MAITAAALALALLTNGQMPVRTPAASVPAQELASPAKPGPFTRLFTAPPRTPTGVTQAPREKVVCGMRVLRGDASVDPRIVLPPNGDTGGMAIRRIVPPVCRE